MKNVVLLAFAATFLMLSCNMENKESTQAVAFRLSDTMMAHCEFYTADLQEVKNEIRLFGKIQADNNKLAQVYSIVGGNVIKINAELGDYVRKGQVLAVIRSGEVAGFERDRLDALGDVAVAEKNLQVARDLFKSKLSSEKDVVAADRELERQKAELARINEVFSIYNLKKGSLYNVTASMSGFIVQKEISPNEQIRPDKSDALFSIAEINEVWAMANVNESDIPKIQVGYEADVRTLSYPDDVYKGKIDKIFSAIDPETKAMKVRVRIPNASYKLKPDMNATVDVRFSEHNQMIAVPSSSVIFDKSKNWVMVFKDRANIETRQVEVYRQIGNITYLSNGLNKGEKVISQNGMLVYDALND
ncbi:efflux RND transporter periplasmic adaptor subunit [Aquirufa rosea]|uniref:Efflux RND transporter periplasmic adaptor subunit n=1 Tax=Aquirufa rosea TaxID=2509241 RepID=A0A4Q1BZQ8_9BACT|nr:efflux RND transporter periplasmic adaptor subunit [Aquirufa rosea]RXK49642.1 efflux RND transporter periplasmic adaptor subunit [Aquirufa rosea]